MGNSIFVLSTKNDLYNQIVWQFQYVEQIREMSIDFVKDGWILILDADERMTPELISEVQGIGSKSQEKQELEEIFFLLS